MIAVICGRRRGGRAAFTLIELLVAASVTVVLATLLLAILSGTAGIWRATEYRADAFREARAALDCIKRDLTNLTACANAPALVLAFRPDTADEDKVNQELHLLSATANTGNSDLCALSYYCVWNGPSDTSGDKSGCYTLRRQFRNSDVTFNRIVQAGHSPLNFTDLYPRAIALPAAEETEELASYIWDLRFTAFSGGTQQSYGTPPQYSDLVPNWVEIRFKALSAGAARKLGTLAVTRDNWKNENDPFYQRLIFPYQQQFVLRVRIPGNH